MTGYHRIDLALTLALLATAPAMTACNGSPSEHGLPSAPSSFATPGGTHDASDDRVADMDGEVETSDLDQPVDALFEATCEHDRKTFECDLCRYEVGVVRADPALFQDNLLRTASILREPVGVTLSLTGAARFDERRVTHVRTQAGGIIRKVNVALGDTVDKGQALMELESIAVGEAQGAYLEARTVLELAARNFERAATLRREAISSEKEYLQAKQELAAAEIRASGALDKLRRLGMDPGDASALDRESPGGRLILRAPAEGVVLMLHAVPGELAATDEALATIGDTAVVWVWADLYERDIARVSRAQTTTRLRAIVTVGAYPGRVFPGVVDLVSPAMEELSRTVKLRVEVPNADGLLLVGMFAKVEVQLPAGEQVLTVPASAVQTDEGRSFVFVYHHDDYYVRRPVRTGRTWADRVEIVDGLPEGETVVAEGSFLLKSDVLRSKMGAACTD